MSNQQEDENRQPNDGDEPAEDASGDSARDSGSAHGPDDDLRSLLGGSGETPSRAQKVEPAQERVEPTTTRDDDYVPPYVPPVRPGDPVRPPDRAPEPEPEWQPRQEQQPDQKLPPVWPGDEKQPWFRRERGLPPLQETEEGGERVLDPEDFPTPLAEIPPRGRAWGVTFLVPNVLGILLPQVGFVAGLLIFFPNLFLFRSGRDVGTILFNLRVVRENGDVAGFFQMFVRNAASTISFLALGAGYWTAFSDPHRRTWHDKWLGTYVVQDSAEYNTRKRSSSSLAYNWFWIIILIVIAGIVMIWLSGPIPTETMTPDGGAGGVGDVGTDPGVEGSGTGTGAGVDGS